MSELAFGETAAGTGTLLSVRDVTVRFGGIVANDAVSLDAPNGAITAVIGPNGAGKSTLFDVITGARIPSTGSVTFAGRDITRVSVHGRARLGIGRTFQNLALVREMTVFENVYLGAARFLGYGAGSALLQLPKVRKRDRIVADETHRCIDELGLDGVASARVDSLPYGDQRRVEMARALALRPRLLLLDEPAAGMGPEETLQLANAVRAIRDRRGTAIVVVEHDLDFIRLCGEVAYVLDFGCVLASGAVDDVLSDPRVQSAYMGKEDADAGAP